MDNPSKTNSEGYMPHLDILRALAIISIVAYHLNVFKFGYLGVDVFLVISGFLFSHSLKRSASSYSPWSTIRKRVCRVLPCMLAVCMVTLAISSVLTPSSYVLTTARQAFSDLLFWGNIYQDIAGGGYMDNGFSSNPLMHLWYLQVLIQMTVVVCFLVFLKRYCRRIYTFIFIFLYIVSLLVFIHFRYEMLVDTYLPLLTQSIRYFDLSVASAFGRHFFDNQDSGYLWTCGRYWMFMSGMVCYNYYMTPQKREGRWHILGGWVLGIIILLATQKPDILSVAATCTVITCGENKLVRKVAEWRLWRELGRYAFAIYLIHWPIYAITFNVIYLYANLQVHIPYRGIATLTTLLLTPLLAYLLHWTIERKHIQERHILYVWIASIVACYSVCLCSGFKCWKEPMRTKSTVWTAHMKFNHVPEEHGLMKDYPVRLNNVGEGSFLRQLVSSYIYFDFSRPYSHELYFLGDKKSSVPTCMLIGDSHIQMYKEGMHDFLQQHGVSGVLLCSYVCPYADSTRIGPEWGRWDYEKSEAFFAWISRHPEIKTFYLGQAWHFQVPQMRLNGHLERLSPMSTSNFIYDRFGAFARRLHSMNRKLYVFAPAPTVPPYRNSLYKEIDQARLAGDMGRVRLPKVRFSEYRTSREDIMEALNKLEDEGVISVLHIEKTLFSDGVFVPFDELHDYVYDEGHLSPIGARKALRGCEDKLLESLK